MIQTAEKVLEVALRTIKKFYLDYNDSGEKIQVSYREGHDLLFNFGKNNVWIVSFEYGKMDYGRDVSGFLTILDDDLKPIYFNTRGGAGKLSDEDLEGIWPLK